MDEQTQELLHTKICIKNAKIKCQNFHKEFELFHRRPNKKINKSITGSFLILRPDWLVLISFIQPDGKSLAVVHSTATYLTSKCQKRNSQDSFIRSTTSTELITAQTVTKELLFLFFLLPSVLAMDMTCGDMSGTGSFTLSIWKNKYQRINTTRRIVKREVQQMKHPLTDF